MTYLQSSVRRPEWVAVALFSIPFDIAIYALEGALKRRKTERETDRGSETQPPPV